MKKVGLIAADPFNNMVGMTEQQLRGRAVLAAYITAVLMMEIIAISLYVSTHGTKHLPSRVVRFALSGALYLWLYRGSDIARGISVLLLGMAGVRAALALFKVGNAVAIASMGSMAFLYLSFAVVLVASPDVRAFLEYQRNSLVTDPLNNSPSAHQ